MLLPWTDSSSPGPGRWYHAHFNPHSDHGPNFNTSSHPYCYPLIAAHQHSHPDIEPFPFGNDNLHTLTYGYTSAHCDRYYSTQPDKHRESNTFSDINLHTKSIPF